MAFIVVFVFALIVFPQWSLEILGCGLTATLMAVVLKYLVIPTAQVRQKAKTEQVLESTLQKALVD